MELTTGELISIIGMIITLLTMVVTVTAVIVTNKNNSDAIKNEVKAVKDDVNRLEQKQDKYNNLQARIVKVEESSKSAHNRLKDFSFNIQRFEDSVNHKLDSILEKVSDHVKEFHTKKED